MAALTAPRDTKQLGNYPVIQMWALPVKANTKIQQGSLVVIDAGFAAPGAAATGLIAAGRARTTVDNTGGAAGAKWIEVERGAFAWNVGGGGDALAQANVGADVFIIDDHTVGLVATARSRAGKLVQIRDDGQVFVETY